MHVNLGKKVNDLVCGWGAVVFVLFGGFLFVLWQQLGLVWVIDASLIFEHKHQEHCLNTEFLFIIYDETL